MKLFSGPEVVRALERLSNQQGRSYGPDVDEVRVSCDAASVMVVYRHRYAEGVFGFRQVVADDDSEPGCADAAELAAQIWYAEIEPVPDVNIAEAIDGVQWWGDPPFPRGEPSA